MIGEVIAGEMGAAISVLRSIVITPGTHDPHESRPATLRNEVIHTYLKQKRITRLVTRSKINPARNSGQRF